MSTSTSGKNAPKVIENNWPVIDIDKDRHNIERNRQLAIEDIWRARLRYLLLIIAILFLTYGFFSLIVDLTDKSPEFWSIIYNTALSLLIAFFGFLLGYLVGVKDGKAITLRSLRFIPKSYKPS